MKTAEPPHNPEGRFLAPGYRFLGAKEPILPTDEICRGEDDWVKLRETGYMTGNPGRTPTRYSTWTIRRALNVDNPHAPPPSEWAVPGWVIVSPGESDHVDVGWQVWSQRLGVTGYSWQAAFTRGTILSDYYYRRPIVATQSRPCGEVPFGAEQECRLPKDSDRWTPVTERLPTDAECEAGLWVTNGRYVEMGRWHGQKGFASCLGDRTHWKIAVLPALPKPVLPAPPKIDGAGGRSYIMEYAKNAKTVQFGCAVIALQLLRAADAMLTTPLDHPSGNRHIAGLTLNSGVSITSAEVAKILAYVDTVNKP